MSLYNVNVEKSKRSLEVRNEVIEMIKDKFDISLGFWFNDLYKVKDGVCRRLKGGMSNVDFRFNDNEEFNEMFNKVKEFIDNLDIEEFDIKLNKRLNYTWNGYYDWKKRCDFEGNFLDYKKECLESEECIILKIRWKG